MKIPLIKNTIASLSDEILKESLEDRLAIIKHKIKFIEAVSVFLSNAQFESETVMNEALELSGGVLTHVVENAPKVICFDFNYDTAAWLQFFSHQMNNLNWAALKHNQIYLIDAKKYQFEVLENRIQLVEDLAEILYPGLFIFGGEGNRWMKFDIC